MIGVNRYPRSVERCHMSDITEEALNTIEESFGTRFVRHAPGEVEPHDEQPFASVFPESAEEVESLMKLASRHSIPLIARGAGTAPYSGRVPRVLVVRFDEMRNIRLPEGSKEDWVEVEPGVTWLILGNRLREKGMGPTVYPTSAPRSTIGGWLAENGLGVGSYEYGWLLENVLSVEVVLAGGKRTTSRAGPSGTLWDPGALWGSLCGLGSRRGTRLRTCPSERSSETRGTLGMPSLTSTEAGYRSGIWVS